MGSPEPSDPIVGPVLAKFQPEEVDGPLKLAEKEMLLAALQFYFGPAQFWKAVVNNDPLRTRPLQTIQNFGRANGPGEELLRDQHIRLQTRSNSTPRPTSGTLQTIPSAYRATFSTKPSKNLTFYVGPDLYHGEPWNKGH